MLYIDTLRQSESIFHNISSFATDRLKQLITRGWVGVVTVQLDLTRYKETRFTWSLRHHILINSSVNICRSVFFFGYWYLNYTPSHNFIVSEIKELWLLTSTVSFNSKISFVYIDYFQLS